MKKGFLTIWFCAVLQLFLSAQETDQDVYDTARRTDPLSAESDYFLRNAAFNKSLDSSMLYLQQYDQTRKDHPAIQNLGDVHTPFKPLAYRHPARLGFRTGASPFMNLYFLSDSVRFYNTYQPYSEFSYAQGSGGQRGMIDFDAFHTQNFGERFNYTIQYHSTSNDGFYLRQTMAVKNLRINSHYTNRKKNYTAAMVVTWNKTNFMENGGILQDAGTDSLFKSLQGNVRLVDVSLNEARNINRQREYRFQQVYRFKNAHDSGRSKLAISHIFSAVREANYYTDAAGDYGFYDSVYTYNNMYSSDSVNMTNFSNRLELFTPKNAKGISFKTGLGIDQMTVFQSANPDNYIRWSGHNTFVYGSLNLITGKYFKPEINAQYTISDYNADNYNLQISNTFQIGDRRHWRITSMLQSSSNNPDYLLTTRKSNHYNWKNDFQNNGGSLYNTVLLGILKKTDKTRLRNAFRYSLPNNSFELYALYSDISRLYYISNENNVVYQNNSHGLLQINTSMHVNLKQFQLHHDFVWQRLSEGLKTSLQLPEFISKSSVYYQNYAFKKATFIQAGIDMAFTSSYRAGLYNPALQEFVSGNTKVGGYPVLDLFVNAEVKTARIFFKMEHFNQDLLPPDYFSNYMFASPFHPYAPRRFRLGFTWKFYY